MTIIDITYTTNIGERHGRRRMYDNHTGEVWWDPLEPDAAAQNLPVPDPLGPVEPLPPASADSLPADPAPPIKPARKPRKKHGA